MFTFKCQAMKHKHNYQCNHKITKRQSPLSRFLWEYRQSFLNSRSVNQKNYVHTFNTRLNKSLIAREKPEQQTKQL